VGGGEQPARCSYLFIFFRFFGFHNIGFSDIGKGPYRPNGSETPKRTAYKHFIVRSYGLGFVLLDVVVGLGVTSLIIIRGGSFSYGSQSFNGGVEGSTG
jgi:hypothetical protein